MKTSVTLASFLQLKLGRDCIVPFFVTRKLHSQLKLSLAATATATATITTTTATTTSNATGNGSGNGGGGGSGTTTVSVPVKAKKRLCGARKRRSNVLSRTSNGGADAAPNKLVRNSQGNAGPGRAISTTNTTTTTNPNPSPNPNPRKYLPTRVRDIQWQDRLAFATLVFGSNSTTKAALRFTLVRQRIASLMLTPGMQRQKVAWVEILNAWKIWSLGGRFVHEVYKDGWHTALQPIGRAITGTVLQYCIYMGSTIEIEVE